MNVTIEIATDTTALRAAAQIRNQVFGGRHCYRRLPQLEAYAASQVLTLIAREAENNLPVATLSVVDTTRDTKLHRTLDLRFSESARVARYSQMAVLKPFRGMHLPARLIAEAHRRFVVPREITHTWLLFPAATAHTCFFCSNMGFIASTGVFSTEYGLSRVLIRNERSMALGSFAGYTPEPSRVFTSGDELHCAAAKIPQQPPRISENEWVAQ